MSDLCAFLSVYILFTYLAFDCLCLWNALWFTSWCPVKNLIEPLNKLSAVKIPDLKPYLIPKLCWSTVFEKKQQDKLLSWTLQKPFVLNSNNHKRADLPFKKGNNERVETRGGRKVKCQNNKSMRRTRRGKKQKRQVVTKRQRKGRTCELNNEFFDTG